MGLLDKIFSSGIGEVAKGIGSLAVDLRTAITGDIPPKEKAELEKILLNMQGLEMQVRTKTAELQSSVIIAEAKGQSWLQRNWRPLLMAMFGVIVANNYIIMPYIQMFCGAKYVVSLKIPPDMWSLLKLGVSGYIVGRSVEKIADGEGLKAALKKIVG